MLKRHQLLLIAATIVFTASACAEQREIEDYETARRLLWSEVYANGGETLYCGRKFGERHGRGINVEHVLPMSWATKALRCGTRKQCRRRSKRFNRLEGDLHNLFPSRSDINKERSAFRFGNISGEKRRFGKCDFEVDYRNRVAEPRPAVRGEVARAMFYMSTEYDVPIFPRFGKLLLSWHRSDPPGADEKRRNNIIEELQGNRNKFIDNPELAKKLRFKSPQ